MPSASKSQLAGRGCCVCGVWADDMLTVDRYGAKICRPCTARLARTIRAASEAFLAEHFVAPAAFRDKSAEEAFEEVKRVVEQQEQDSASRMDLAICYDEIGRPTDAVCSAAYALVEDVPHARASTALNWIFAPERAWPGAFRTIVLSMKGLL